MLSVPLLVALALAQPVLRRHGTVATRADAGVFAVVDTSSSMAAVVLWRAPPRRSRRRVARSRDTVSSQLTGFRSGWRPSPTECSRGPVPDAETRLFNWTIDTLTIQASPFRRGNVAASYRLLGACRASERRLLLAAERRRGTSADHDGRVAWLRLHRVARALAASPACTSCWCVSSMARIGCMRGRDARVVRLSGGPRRASQPPSRGFVAATVATVSRSGCRGRVRPSRRPSARFPRRESRPRPGRARLRPFILLVALGVSVLLVSSSPATGPLDARGRTGRSPPPARARATPRARPSEPEGAGWSHPAVAADDDEPFSSAGAVAARVAQVGGASCPSS